MNTVLAATDLRHEYPDGTVAIENLSLTIESGERVAIVGPNGAGKSTLLSLLGGLRQPDSGTVTYFEETTVADDVRDRLSVVTQQPQEYLFNPTVEADLLYGPAQLEIPESEARERVERLLDRLDLTEHREKPPGRLSGGQQRRAALASALTVDPEVLLVDEPLADLDGTYRDRVRSLLDEHASAGGTVVISTPDVDVVPSLADRVVLLDREGSVVADGPTAELLTDSETLEGCGLHPPQIVRLFERAGVENPPVTMDDAVDRLQKE